MVVRKDKVDAHKSIEAMCPRETRGGCTILSPIVPNVLQNNKRNNNAGIVREVSPSPPWRVSKLPSTSTVSYESQLDTSMGSPGVTGISNGVVKPDTEVDDGTDISTVSLVVVLVVPCVIFLRKS